MTQEDILRTLPVGTVIKSQNPFVVIVPPGVALSAEQAKLVQQLQMESSKPTAVMLTEGKPYSPTSPWSKAAEWAGKGRELGLAVGSRALFGTVPLEILNLRWVSCFGKDRDGEVKEEPCPNLRLSKNGKTHHCAGCGCGDTIISQLDDGKLEYPHLNCPLKRPGFSNSETQNGRTD